MSAPLPDNISPVAPEQFHEVFMPRTQLGLRIALAVLTLAYMFFVPGFLTLTPYMVFMVGVIIYISLQSLLTLLVMLNGARSGLVYSLTVIDAVAVVTSVLNDPAPLPATLILVLAMLGVAVAQHRASAYTTVFVSTLVGTLVALALRYQLQHHKLDFPFFAQVLFTVAAASVLPMVSGQVEALRLRTARVTDLDPLTGLGNRWTFYEAAKYLLPYHHRNLTPMVVMFAEIEVTKRKGKKVTKAINDFLLKQFASIADQRLRSSDVAVHYGGNEFAFLLVDTTTKDAEAIAFDMQQQFNQWAKQKDLPAYAHIGLAVVPHRPVALDQILISINAALYRARQYKKGVSGAVFADPEQVR